MADGEVSLDFLINDEATSSVDKIVDHAVKGAGTIDASTNKSASKVREEAAKTRSELNKQFGKETRVKLVTEFDKAGVKNFDETLEKLPKEKQVELLTKADKGELIDVQKEIKDLPPTVKSEIELKDNASPEIKKVAALSKKDIHQKLVADADTHGIKNFDTLLKKLPKKTQTELLAKAEKGEVINYEKTLRKLPAKVITSAHLNDNASPQLRKLQGEAEATKSKFSSFKSVMAGTFAGNLALGALTKGMQLFTSSIGAAVSRVDTLNNSQRVFANIGISAKDARKGADDLKNAIHGLPTALDDATKHQQLLTSSMSGDVGNATKVFKSLNDGILGFGGTTDQVNEAVTQLSQSFSNGKVDGQTWLSMINAGMGPALEAIAKKMHKTTGELQEGLSDGSISVKDFQDQLIEMDEKGGGGIASLNKIAKDATKGMQTSFVNMKAAVVRTMGGLVAGVAPAMTKGMEGLTKSLDNVAPAFQFVGKVAGQALGGIVSVIGNLTGKIAKLTGSGIKILGSAFKPLQKQLGTLLVNNIKHAGDAFGGFFNGVKKGFGISSDSLNDFIKGIQKKMALMPVPKLDFSFMTSSVKKVDKELGKLGTSFKNVAYDIGLMIKPLSDGIWDVFKDTILPVIAIGAKVLTKVFDVLVLSIKFAISTFVKLLHAINPIVHVFENMVDGFAKNKSAVEGLGIVIESAITGFVAFKGISLAVNGAMKAGKTIAAGYRGAIALLPKAMTAAEKSMGLFKAAVGGMSHPLKSAKTGLKGLATGFKGLNTAAKANVFIAIISTIIALGVAFYELYKHNKKFKKFVDGIAKNVGGFFKSAGKVIDKGIKAIQKAFKGIINFFKKDWKEILLFMVNPFAGAFAFLYKHNKKFRNGVNSVVKWFKSVFKSFGKWLDKTWHDIWDPIKDFFGDVFKFFKKAWDTWYKRFTRNLIDFNKWIGKTWHNIWKPIADFFGDIWDGIKKTAKNAWNWLTDTLSTFGKTASKVWHGIWNPISKFFGNIWDGIKETAQTAWDWITDKMDAFGSTISKGWRSLWNGLSDFFSDIWDDIKKLAKDGLKGIIGFINTGIGGINSVIHMFGGKKTTIDPISTKFAQGTKGAPRGLAMVNDGFDSPTGQELIIDNQGRGTILEGRNQLVNFEGGETVVPANVTHSMLNGKFADGTNDWFGGLKNFFGDAAEDIGDMMKKATGKAAQFFNIAKNPFGYIKDKIFSPVTEGINNTKGSAVKALGKAFNSGDKGVKGNQNKWWKELWNMLKDTLSGSGKGGFGDDYLFKGHAKDDGSDPYGYFFRECVSFVASRLKNEGVNPKLFTGLGNGSDWGSARVPHSSTPRVGDIAQYGSGSLYGNHVAVVTDVKGNKYREEGYNQNNNGKYYNSAQWHNASDASTFLRFPGAKGGKMSKGAGKKASPLQKMIKKQVGGMFDWVSDMVGKLMPSISGSDSQAPSGDHKHWLSQAGIKGNFDKWNYIISHESGWNPHAKNPGSDAYGIGQALPPSKMAAFGSDYMSNPITQLKWMQSYVNERYGGINGAYDFWHSHNWYANGGWGGNKVGIFNEVPGQEEIAINPHRSTSDQHIAEVIDKRSQLAPNSSTAKLQNYAHAIKQDMVSEPQMANVSHSSNSSGPNSNNGSVSLSDLKGTTIKFVSELNGKVIAEETADMISMIQSKNSQINAYGAGQGGLLNG